MKHKSMTKPADNLHLGDLPVRRMGYGAMQLTGPGVIGDPADRQNALKLLREAVNIGINFIDTADAYGPYTNETLIADALHPYSSELVIATKGGFERGGPNLWTVNGRPDYIRKAIDASLLRLKLSHIDLWQLHRIDPKVPVEETLGPVKDAIKEGKIRYAGLSEVSISDIEKAETTVPIVSVQNHYNLSHRKWEKVLDYTQKRGIAFIPWYPLASGPDKLTGLVDQLSKKHGATPAQIALAWLLHRSPNILLIPGTSSLSHLRDNVKATQIRLSSEDVESLSK